MSRKAHFFRQKPEDILNLYIGGVSSVIPNASTLESVLGLSTGAVSIFNIKGNNIEAKVDEDYDIPFRCFAAGFAPNNFGSIVTYYIDLERCKTLFQQSFLLQSNIKFCYFLNADDVPSVQTWRLCTSLEHVGIPKVNNDLGSIPNIDRGNFNQLTNNLTNIYVNPYLITNNSGNLDADLQTAINLYSANVVSVINENRPDAITDLSGSNITSNSVDLNFTTPSSSNTINLYEVWLNGSFYDWISNSGDTLTGLSSSFSYDIELISVDIYYNRSESFSNKINITTL
jgi:hypothetical protein